jgi:uncharacterized protein YjiS (DUF1127 family)
MSIRIPAARLDPLPRVAAPAGLWRGFVARLSAAGQAVATRRTLLEMDARMLKDIGITHAQAIEEARRMPWDLQRRR